MCPGEVTSYAPSVGAAVSIPAASAIAVPEQTTPQVFSPKTKVLDAPVEVLYARIGDVMAVAAEDPW